MKIVGIACSPRKEGNTEILVQEALSAIQELGGETKFIGVSNKTINPCDSCYTCMKEEGICRINDDMQEIYQELLQCDGVILGTPVYFINVSAQAKAVMDRIFALFVHRKLKGKVAGAIAVARKVGAGQTLQLMYSFFISNGMHVAGGAIGYGQKKGEVREGPGGIPNVSALDEARRLGRAVASLHQKLSK